jgi:hypothetical protein
MSLIATFRAPGHGRRQAKPEDRLAAEVLRLRAELKREQEARRITHAELRQTASVLGEWVALLGEEQAAHFETRSRLDTAVRANESNVNADTIQTDVTALRAAIADVVPEDARPVPQYRPFWRLPMSAIRVVPLWHSPQAAHPARIPGADELAGAR